MRQQQTPFVQELSRARVVAVVRARDAAGLQRQVDHALECGIRAVEVTTTGDGWADVLAAAAAAHPECVVGAGTVTTREHVREALASGATFLVAPRRVGEDVVRAAGSVPFVQGGFTPTELAAIADGGAEVAKLFPASTGGTAHLRALRDVLPGLQVMPTGGVTVDDARDWIDAGAIAVGIGGALLREPVARVQELLARLGVASRDG